MIRPADYERWAREADPKCPTCRGMGYARIAQIPPLSGYFAGAIPTPMRLPSVETRCECAKTGAFNPKGKAK